MSAARSILAVIAVAGLGACGGGTASAPPVVAEVPPPPTPSEPIVRVPIDASMPSRGPDDAAVTIVMFEDLECPFCARAEATMDRLMERYPGDLRLVFRHNPLAYHTHAMAAAEAAMEAQAQLGDEAFFRMVDLLFAQREHLEPSDLEGYASYVGLDLPRFRLAMSAHVHRAAIEADMAAAASLGATGTPTFFVNGHVIRGAVAFDVFDAEVALALHDAHLRIAAGVPRDGVYADVLRYATTLRVPDDPDRRARADDEDDEDRVVVLPIPATAPSRGPATAPVVIQIASDFQCPFCSRVLPTIEELERRYPGRLRFVWRDFPLPFHDDALAAHEAAREAYAQRGDAGFWAMHDLLYENQDRLEEGDALLEELAGRIGLDLARFRAALAGHVHQAAIDGDIVALRATGMTGTPTFFVNGHLLVGAQPVDAFAERIDAELTAGP